MSEASFASLEALTQMVLDAELAQLRAAAEEVAVLKAEREALLRQKAERAEVLHKVVAEEDIAFSTGQDALWRAWVDRATARLTSEMAQAAARQEAQRLRAQKAFGRVDALGRLREREATGQRVLAMRRAGEQAG